MRKMLTLFLSISMLSLLVASNYEAGADFRIDNKLMFDGDANFSDFQSANAQGVIAGMDFDNDGMSEILFTIDETLYNGPDPGKIGIYLYESDGAGGYTYVWHFVSPDPGNSLPGYAHGDIDGDGNHEIYFGVPPATSNDATWGTYIFEQGSDGTFPAAATLLHRYGMTTADNFRPAGYALADLDGDGKVELATIDRGGRRLSIDALAGDALDNLATFSNEFLDEASLDGGGVYDIDVADTDNDGRPEVWVNTWNSFSMTVFESTGPNAYSVESDLNAIFPTSNDPGSFNRAAGFAFTDLDNDYDMDAWFPMTNGKLYYFENTSLDSIAPNVITNGGVDGGTTGWGFYPDNGGISVIETGDTLLFSIDTTTYTDINGADSVVYDTTHISFEASVGDSALAIPELAASAAENNAFFTYTGANALPVGTQFIATAHVHPGLSATTGSAVLFAKYFTAAYSFVGMDSKSVNVSDLSMGWNPMEIFANVPGGAEVVQVGVMYVSGAGTGVIYLDELTMSPVIGNGVAGITADNFTEVLTFGSRSRGSSMGNIDGDSKPDIIAGTGSDETVVWMEYIGSDPKDPMSYTMTTILSAQGEPSDRFYPLHISDTDLDGDGRHEVVISNLRAGEDRAGILVLEHAPYAWSNDGGNEDLNINTGWTVIGHGVSPSNDLGFNNTRTAIGGMDMDMDGKHEVITTSYAGRVNVYEMNTTSNVFDVVWQSPVPDSLAYTSSVRAVNVGDLDGDGKHEIVFPVADANAYGFHIYEWDGVVGSDNYGTTFSSVNNVEVGICCPDGAVFRGRTEQFEIDDVDGDGQNELIVAIRDGLNRGLLITTLAAGDDIVHDSGGGLETWSQEYKTESTEYGGGSPYHALPVDLNGDGQKEIVNHHWNNFNFYNVAATGPDTYEIAPAGSEGSFYKATGTDQHSLNGGRRSDIDGDGNQEAFFATYGAGFGFAAEKGDLYVVDYDAGDDVKMIGPDQVKRVGVSGGEMMGGIGNSYDGNTNPHIFAGSFSSKQPNVSAHEFIGPDASSGSSYLKKAIYYGELDVAEATTTTDEAGTTTTTYRRKWGYTSDIQASWGDDLLDFDGDGKKELLVSFQSQADSLTHKTYTWNATLSKYDTVLTTVANTKNWEFAILENGSDALSTDDPITFISPEEYRLEQNYPNPFNPNTTIQYTVPIDRKVSVKIYNVNGQLVNTLINNELVSAGTHKVTWNGKNKNGLTVSTGMYFYSLEWAGMKKVKSMTLLK